MTTGQLIQRARKKAGLTQAELAEKIGASVVTIGQYERNKRQPRIEQLCLISKALGVTVASLLPGEPIDLGFFGLKGHRIDGKIYLTEESLKAIKSRPKPTPEELEKQKKEAEEIEALMAEYEAEKDAPSELKILQAYHKLNLDGQKKAIDRVEELTEIPRYQRQEPPKGTDTTPPGEKPSEGG